MKNNIKNLLVNPLLYFSMLTLAGCNAMGGHMSKKEKGSGAKQYYPAGSRGDSSSPVLDCQLVSKALKASLAAMADADAAGRDLDAATVVSNEAYAALRTATAAEDRVNAKVAAAAAEDEVDAKLAAYEAACEAAKKASDAYKAVCPKSDILVRAEAAAAGKSLDVRAAIYAEAFNKAYGEAAHIRDVRSRTDNETGVENAKVTRRE